MTEGRIKRRLDPEKICHVKTSPDFWGKDQFLDHFVLDSVRNGSNFKKNRKH
jgi:hypothetical protein